MKSLRWNNESVFTLSTSFSRRLLITDSPLATPTSWRMQFLKPPNREPIAKHIKCRAWLAITCLLQSTMRGGLFEATAGSERMEWRNSATSRIYKMEGRCMLWFKRTSTREWYYCCALENLFCNCSWINDKEDPSRARTIPTNRQQPQSEALPASDYLSLSRYPSFFSFTSQQTLSDIWVIFQKCQFEWRKGCQAVQDCS